MCALSEAAGRTQAHWEGEGRYEEGRLRLASGPIDFEALQGCIWRPHPFLVCSVEGSGINMAFRIFKGVTDINLSNSMFHVTTATSCCLR